MSIRKPSLVPEKKKTKLMTILAALGLNSLLISILVHIFFIGVATVIVVEVFQKKHTTFQEAAPIVPHDEVEHKVELAKKTSVDGAPPDLKRITTTSLSAITLPDPPELSKVNDDTPPTISGLDGISGSSMGSGTGVGTGTALSIPTGSAGFGATDGVGLIGTFYDLKQTSEDTPQPTNITQQGWRSVMLNFAPHFDESVFGHYYKGTQPRITNGFAIAEQSSANAPEAFGLAGKVKPSLWAIVYRTHLIAPADGRYRFVGFGDDVLLIRANGVVVGDLGWQALTKNPDLRKDYPFDFIANTEAAHLHGGTWFNVSKGDPVNLEVLIGDWGGLCGFYLMLEKEGETYPITADGTPAFPLFQVGAKLTVPPPDRGRPPCSPSDEVWMVDPSYTPGSSPDGL